CVSPWVLVAQRHCSSVNPLVDTTINPKQADRSRSSGRSVRQQVIDHKLGIWSGTHDECRSSVALPRAAEMVESQNRRIALVAKYVPATVLCLGYVNPACVIFIANRPDDRVDGRLRTIGKRHLRTLCGKGAWLWRNS